MRQKDPLRPLTKPERRALEQLARVDAPHFHSTIGPASPSSLASSVRIARTRLVESLTGKVRVVRTPGLLTSHKSTAASERGSERVISDLPSLEKAAAYQPSG